ncbi:MAG: Rho termination factor N-terminal domain-containing protein, partial [Bacillota bacterium]|nr:Rho termination factor N-terminal domain-containing protein [Bacillota bacterium]
QRGDHVIDVPSGAFEQDYRELGYVPVEAEDIESDQEDIEKMNVDALRDLAQDRGIEGFEKMKKAELLEALKAGE